MLYIRSLCGLFVLALSGCTTAVHDGGLGPDRETATLESAGTYVDQIDGRDADAFTNGKNHVRFKIPPGEHALEVGLNDSLNQSVMRSFSTMRIYLNAEPGHVYLIKPTYRDIGPRASLTEPRYFDRRWGPQIIDEATGKSVGFFKQRDSGSS